ncbi:MAG: prepilin-type N-terminal cleavage/methylation domain-containing protein [Clostridiales bacterium]|nr:prepilin-type N-terminal cleavage/methylation domain-containing protein [Clostridiales bacterium]
MRRYIKSNRFGLTLVELIVVVAIMAIILVAVMVCLVKVFSNTPELDMIG